MRLIDIDYPVTATVDLVLIHVHLLIKDVLYHLKDLLIPLFQREPAVSFLFNFV